MIGDRSFGGLKLLLLIICVVGLGLLGVLAFRAGPAPVVKITSNLPAISKRTTIKASVEEPARGLSQVKMELIQGERIQVLAEKNFSYRGMLSFSGPITAHVDLSVDVGRDTMPELKSGEAIVRVTAHRVGS